MNLKYKILAKNADIINVAVKYIIEPILKVNLIKRCKSREVLDKCLHSRSCFGLDGSGRDWMRLPDWPRPRQDYLFQVSLLGKFWEIFWTGWDYSVLPGKSLEWS